MLQARHGHRIGSPDRNSGAIRYESRMNGPKIPEPRDEK
jgi:hypothetical protein